MKKVLYNTIQDNSYTTVRHGRVPSYSGVQLIRDGGQWIAERGLGPLGGPDRITEIGSIKRISSDTEPQFWTTVAHSARCSARQFRRRETDVLLVGSAPALWVPALPCGAGIRLVGVGPSL